MPDDSLEILVKMTADIAGGKEAQRALAGVTGATGEAGKAAEKAHISHGLLHKVFRQVGEASKGLEIGLMALTGVMMGSVTFAVAAVGQAMKMLGEHFEKQREVALEAAKVTVQFWQDALQGHAAARTAAENYAEAMGKIIKNVDVLKQKEEVEEAALKRVLEVRLKILDAQMKAELALAKGDKEAEGRIEARYGQQKSALELKNEQENIDLKKKHLTEQQGEAMGKGEEAKAAERAKEAAMKAGVPNEVTEAKLAMAGLEEKLKKAIAAQLSPEDKREATERLAYYNAHRPFIGTPGAFDMQHLQSQLAGDQTAHDTEAGLKGGIANRTNIIAAYERKMEALTKGGETAMADFNKAVERARATRNELEKDEAAQRVNVGAAKTIGQIEADRIVKGVGVNPNALSRNVMGDINAMTGMGGGQRMDAGQTQMVNHLIAGLKAQGASQATINGLLREMSDLHVSAEKKFVDIWTALRQVKKQAKSQAGPR